MLLYVSMNKQYDIWAQPTAEGPDYPPYGVEIEPPLIEVAAQGLCRVLTRRPPEGETNNNRHAVAAYVTRSDEVGTALIVYPRPNNPNFDAEYLANLVQTYIDPTDRLAVELHVP